MFIGLTRSVAMIFGSADPSASIPISVGPATCTKKAMPHIYSSRVWFSRKKLTWSIPHLPKSCRLASATNLFPGPTARCFVLYFAYIYDICLEISVIFAPIICAEKFNTYEICLQACEQTKGKSSNSLGKWMKKFAPNALSPVFTINLRPEFLQEQGYAWRRHIWGCTMLLGGSFRSFCWW